MGKNLIQQRRGKGSIFKACSFRHIGKPSYSRISETAVNGKITDLIHCAGHTAPLAEIKYDNGEKGLVIAADGIKVGDNIQTGKDVDIKIGNIIPLKNIPEGTLIYNIESNPGGGGKFVRSSGVFAKIITHMGDKVIIQLPSKKQKSFNPDCRASIGMIAGSGRKEKPFLKAGTKYHRMRAKHKQYPKVCGVSMNAVDHPFGGTKSSHKGKPTTAPRHAPPGRKVGAIRPRRRGRTKR